MRPVFIEGGRIVHCTRLVHTLVIFVIWMARVHSVNGLTIIRKWLTC
jgi:hypothetical protein